MNSATNTDAPDFETGVSSQDAVDVSKSELGDMALQANHIAYTSCILPPEWDLTPWQYRALVCDTRPPSYRSICYSGVATTVFALGMLLGDTSDNDPATFGNALFLFSVVAACFSSIILLSMCVAGVTRRLRDTSVLDTLDPNLVLNTGDLPDEIVLLLRESDYELAEEFVRIGESTGDWSLKNMIQNCGPEVDFIVTRGLESDTREVTANAMSLCLYLQHTQGTPLLGMGVADSAVAPTDGAPESTPRESLRTLWKQSVETHDRVVEAWTYIVTDPLEVLSHSSLLDMSQTRSSTFIEHYGHAQDLRAIHGVTYPGDETAAREYLSTVRKTEEAWTEALRYSEHVGFTWLANKDEEKAARQAASLLTLAADQPDTPEGINAAKQAQVLLRKVKSFMLPPKAMHALETRARLELPTRAQHGRVGGNILTVASEQVSVR